MPARRREDHLAGKVVSLMGDKGPVDQIEPGSHLWKVHAEVGEHVDVLRALPWKEKSELSLPAEWFLEEVDAA